MQNAHHVEFPVIYMVLTTLPHTLSELHQI